ncbi:hypothetical protein D3C80_1844930 [compost metagenome]
MAKIRIILQLDYIFPLPFRRIRIMIGVFEIQHIARIGLISVIGRNQTQVTVILPVSQKQILKINIKHIVSNRIQNSLIQHNDDGSRTFEGV